MIRGIRSWLEWRRELKIYQKTSGDAIQRLYEADKRGAVEGAEELERYKAVMGPAVDRIRAAMAKRWPWTMPRNNG